MSPHKFIGGPNTTGVMIAKKNLFKNVVPAIPGGGTVHFVNDKFHYYNKNIEAKEEGGTPNIIACIRSGLIFKLKEIVGEEIIKKKEEEILDKVIPRIRRISNLLLLANNRKPKVAIMLFMIKSHGKFLHYNFVSILLNDLFGLQTRGGCSCAALYGLNLLGIGFDMQIKLKKAVDQYQLFRGGYVRLNFSYIMDNRNIDYILKALEFVSLYGWMFLPLYRQHHPKDIWSNIAVENQEPNRLGKINFSEMNYSSNQTFIHKAHDNYDQVLDDARQSLSHLLIDYRGKYLKSGSFFTDTEEQIQGADLEPLIWFLRPLDVI
jgi:hypothetical protein